MVAAFSVKPTLGRPEPHYVYTRDAPKPAFPWLTIGLMAVIAVIFAIEMQVSPRSVPGWDTLVAMGGLTRDLALQGEAYRLLAAPFLHGTWPHLAVDLLLLGFAGTMLERMAGRAWMFLIFASGALAGSAMSLLKDAPAKLSIGGSSALFAMLAALLVMSFHISEPAKKTRIQFAGLTLLLLGLLPIPHVIGAVAADFSAPIGGVAIGGLIGLLLLLTWPADAARPGFRKLAAIFASVAALSFMSAAYAVSFHYPQYAKSGLFIPPAQYPQDPSEFRARANELFAQYPRDPRAHLIAGRAGLLRGDRVGAEYEFRAAMTLINDQTAQQFPPLENTIRAWLATTLLDQGRRMEAQSIAKEACSAKGAAAASADIAAILLKSGLCTISHR